MAWKKVPEELARFLEQKMAGFNVQPRQMFGCPAYFVGDNMMAGAHQEDIMIRLGEADRLEFLETFDEAALFEPFEGRPMREYVLVPESVQADDALFDAWLRRSFDYASSLPPKKKKAKKRTAAGKGGRK